MLGVGWPRSIRWRLPLSYAGISILAAVLLGAVLMVTLAGYYRGQERGYVATNAASVASNTATLIEAGVPTEALTSQLRSFAFLTQTRLRFIDASGVPLVDTGDPRDLTDTATISLGLSAEGITQEFSQELEDGVTKRVYRSVIEVGDTGDRSTIDITETVRVTGTSAFEEELVSSFPAAGGSFGLDLGTGVTNGRRSRQVAVAPVVGLNGELGTIELSMGPAIGRDVLTTVAWGWAVSGAVAVVLAATAGWYVSRRMVGPILQLSEASSRMAQGDLTARAMVTRDDEIGELSDQLNLMASRLEETVTTLKMFVADAAHELNTPLTALRTDLELAARELAANGPDEPGSSAAGVRHLIDRASGQIARLESISSGLLDLSKIGPSGGMPTSNFDLAAIVRSVADQFASRADQADVALLVGVVGAEAPVEMVGRETELRKAVSNLIDNAVKFTPAGGTVEVVVGSEARHAVLTVTDTGLGVPADELTEVFQRFRRGRNAATYPGSGLGLAIVRAVVEGHGGSVSLESGDGGTTVTVRIPL